MCVQENLVFVQEHLVCVQEHFVCSGKFCVCSGKCLVQGKILRRINEIKSVTFQLKGRILLMCGSALKWHGFETHLDIIPEFGDKARVL